jgi:putative Holliday junction resolvase
MRVLGIDLGERRIGLAISDPSATLARPLLTLTMESPTKVGRHRKPLWGRPSRLRSRARAQAPARHADARSAEAAGGPSQHPVDRVVREVERLAAEEDGLAAIVVGVPSRLDGSPTDQTARATAFITALQKRTAIPVVGEDERLTSREAESRLALGQRDWKKRKAQLDAASAAVILQDYLDRR